MKIIISGATGFIGTKLAAFLEQQGYNVFRLVLKNTGLKNEILWNPQAGYIELEKIPKDTYAVVNLAGENISQGRWSDNKKKKILESRVKSTELLADSIKKTCVKPEVWINASASGFYGNTKEKLNIETDKPGNAFLSRVCEDWEAKVFEFKEIFNRVIILRFGVALDKEGGALKKMLPVFKSGLGGKLGSGKQYFPWISLEDIIYIINFSLHEDVSGVFNATSPDIITNETFTKALSKALGKPALLPVPTFGLKLVFGQMAEEVLLMSSKVSSKKLTEAGYEFKHKNIYEFLFSNFTQTK